MPRKNPPVDRIIPVEELALRFQRQVIETTRKSLAMRRHAPGAVCRWRRAAPSGPNSKLALVVLWHPGEPPKHEVWPYEKIEELAARVSDQEVFAELARRIQPRID